MFTVLDKDNSIWFVVGDNPLCIMFYDGFLIYASTQEILCKTLKKLRLKAPSDILEPQEGEIMKIDRNGRITTGTFTPHTTFEHWWRKYPFYRSYYEDTPANYDDLFSVAKAFGVTADEVQALLDYGCSEEEIEEMLYDPELCSRDDRRTAVRILRKGDVAYDSIRPYFPGCRRGGRFDYRGRRKFLGQLKEVKR